MKDIHARAPVDRVAVRVVMFRGEHWEPLKRVQTIEAEAPFRIKEPDAAALGAGTFVDLTGTRFGRFTVLGMAADFPGRWSVRCQCGRYSTRRAKAIKNPKNADDMCDHCRHLHFLKKSEYWRRTGKDDFGGL